MSDEEIFVSSKTPDGNICSPSPPPSSDKGVHLTKEKAKTAEAARQTAMEILKDALKKKDRVLMENLQVLFSDDSGDIEFWRKHHAIAEEQLVADLISELTAVTFKEDPTMENTYSYVYPKSKDKTMYLCPLFWKASTELGECSRPGILIHEASHFLGTCDIPYPKASIDVASRGELVKSSSSLPVLNLVFLCLTELNDTSTVYRLPIALNHNGKYENGQYSCCGEKAVNSVCEKAVLEEVYSQTIRKSVTRKKKFREIVKESLLQETDKVKRDLPELRQIADDIDKVHKGATIANITGGTVGIAGGITTIVGLALIPVTFGASLIVSLTGLAVSTAGGLTSAAASATDIGVSKVKKDAALKLIKECQSAVDSIYQFTNIIHVRAKIVNNLVTLSQIGSGAGRIVLNTIKMVKAGQLLANAGRVARFAGHATHVLTALTLALDIAFVAKDSADLHKGAKTEVAANIRKVAEEMEKILDEVSQIRRIISTVSCPCVHAYVNLT